MQTNSEKKIFFWPHLRHVEVPLPGIKPMPEQRPEPQSVNARSLILWATRELPNSNLLLLFFFFYYLGAHMEVNQSCSCQPQPQPQPQPQQCRIRAVSVTYTTTLSNAGSLTHWARPGIEPATSWLLVRLFNPWATKGTPQIQIFKSLWNPRRRRVQRLITLPGRNAQKAFHHWRPDDFRGWIIYFQSFCSF